MVKAVEEGRRDALLRLNYEFHFLIYATARSAILLPMIESLWLQVGPFTYFSIPSPKALWNTKHHRDILSALKADDADAAADAIPHDILNTAQFLQTPWRFASPRLRKFVDLAA